MVTTRAKSTSPKLRVRGDVSLAPLCVEHAPAMFRWMSDSEVSAHVGLRREPSLEGTRAWIERAQVDATIRPCAVMLAGRHLGNVVLDRIDRHLSTARLSIYIGEAGNRGGGLGSAALYQALALAFDELELYKVWLTVHARNARAIGVYERLGFQVEGVLRGEFLLHGERIDCLYMGQLRNDFQRWRTACEFV